MKAVKGPAIFLAQFAGDAPYPVAQAFLEPDILLGTPLNEAPQVIARARPTAGPGAAQATRVPAGHPEGCLERLAQLYRDAVALISARRDGTTPDPACALLPGAQDGLRGVRFVAAAVRSSNRNAARGVA